MILGLLLLALQDPAPVVERPAAIDHPAVDVYAGAIEAPEQPFGASSSDVTRGPRYQPRVEASAGRLGRMLTHIRSLVAVRGQEENAIVGVGLVTGLAGTGDSGDAAKQLLQNYLRTQNINLDLGSLSSNNIAVVRVEATLPSGSKPGLRVDVRVSTIGDAQSLEGGTLTLTELTDITGTLVYATASGPVTVGGFSAGGDGASATRNHVTVATLPGGGKVERAVDTNVVSDHGYIYLDARLAQSSLGNIVRIVEAINGLYPNAAEALADGTTVKVNVPRDIPSSMYIAYLNTLLELEVESENLSRVVINERSGVIVMGGDVRLRPGAVAQGNLTVTIAETPEASQPGPLSQGSTENLPRTSLDVQEDNNALIMVPGAVTLQEVVDVLNVLGTTPRDLISILQAMSQGGLLVADIQRM